MTLPKTMKALVAMGHDGLHQMVQQDDLPCPTPAAGAVPADRAARNSGAIASSVVELDLRFCLRNLAFAGSAAIAPEIMSNLLRRIESGEIKPAFAAACPLEKLRVAQVAFIAKEHAGNIVATP